MTLTRKLGLPVVLMAMIAAPVAVAKVKVRTQHDKTFSFAGLRTYAWHPTGAGDVKLLQATGEDPEVLKASLEPMIKESVEAELGRRGFAAAASGQADLLVNYYVLIGPAMSSQYMGQFLGAVPEWGLPPFAGATTSFKAFEQGSLIVDLTAPALKSVVWRGAADTEIDRQRTPAQRQQLIRDAVREMLKKFPPKK